MGVTREEFSVLVKAMKSAYAQATFIPDKDAFDVWYSLLNDIDYQILSSAIQNHMKTVDFPPTVASLRKQALAIVKPEEEPLSEHEVWNLVYQALDSADHKAEFDKLPPLVQKVVGSPNNLREWSYTDFKSLSVIESNVMRSYRWLLESKQAREKQQMLTGRFDNLQIGKTENLEIERKGE